jgi:hypothetical protein
MMTPIKKLSLALALFSGSLIFVGDKNKAHCAPPSEFIYPRIELSTFRINQLTILQGSLRPNSAFSWEASWNPRYEIDSTYAVGLNLGYSLMPGVRGTYASIFESTVLGSARIQSWIIEFGLGRELWFTSPSVSSWKTSTNVHYQLVDRFLNFIDTVFVGHSIVYQTFLTHELKIGIQVCL